VEPRGIEPLTSNPQNTAQICGFNTWIALVCSSRV
jgi:hypothetical protein